MRTIKSTRREEIEMVGNVNVFLNTCFHLHDPTMNVNINAYIENMLFNRGYSASNTVQVMHRPPDVARISSIFSNGNTRFFTSCKVGHIRYTSFYYSKSKAADDSAAICKLGNEFHFGLITSIFAGEDDDILLELWPISNAKILKIVTKSKTIQLPSIQEETLENNNNFYYVPIDDIVEKCVYWRKESKRVIFFCYQNLEESS